MCTPLVLLHALAIVGIVFAFIALALYDGKLTSHFEQKHPEVWADLGRRKVMFADGDMQTAALHLYLLRGEHKNSRTQSSIPWSSEAGCWLCFFSAAL